MGTCAAALPDASATYESLHDPRYRTDAASDWAKLRMYASLQSSGLWQNTYSALHVQAARARSSAPRKLSTSRSAESSWGARRAPKDPSVFALRPPESHRLPDGRQP